MSRPPPDQVRDAVMSSAFMSRDDRKAYLAAMQREASRPKPAPKGKARK